MTAHPRSVAASVSVERFIEDYLLGDRHSAYPVTSEDGGCTGLVTLSEIREVPAAERRATRLGDIAVPRGRMATAEPPEPLVSVLERLDPRTGNRIVVLDAGRAVGILTAADIARTIDVRSLAAAGRRAPVVDGDGRALPALHRSAATRADVAAIRNRHAPGQCF